MLFENIKERDIEKDKNTSNNSNSTYSNHFKSTKKKLTVLEEYALNSKWTEHYEENKKKKGFFIEGSPDSSESSNR
jgi:hypothetical protein